MSSSVLECVNALTPPISPRLEMREILIVMKSLMMICGESGEEFRLERGFDVSAVTFSLKIQPSIEG